VSSEVAAGIAKAVLSGCSLTEQLDTAWLSPVASYIRPRCELSGSRNKHHRQAPLNTVNSGAPHIAAGAGSRPDKLGQSPLEDPPPAVSP
jgi:hypothetical protein